MGQPFSLARLPSCEIGWARSGVNGPFTWGSSCTTQSNQLVWSWNRLVQILNISEVRVQTCRLQAEQVRQEPRAKTERRLTLERSISMSLSYWQLGSGFRRAVRYLSARSLMPIDHIWASIVQSNVKNKAKTVL